MLNKTDVHKITVVSSQGLYIGGGVKVVAAKLVGWGRGGINIYKQYSIVNTGNANGDFKLMTHNRYSVVNGSF